MTNKKKKWKQTWVNNELKMARLIGKDSIEVRDLYWTEGWRGLLYGFRKPSAKKKGVL
jgi:methionyl-tRNA synthetase